MKHPKIHIVSVMLVNNPKIFPHPQTKKQMHAPTSKCFVPHHAIFSVPSFSVLERAKIFRAGQGHKSLGPGSVPCQGIPERIPSPVRLAHGNAPLYRHVTI